MNFLTWEQNCITLHCNEFLLVIICPENNSAMNEHPILIEKEQDEEGTCMGGIPVCGGNLETPVIDIVQHIDEIRYTIGSKLYIENAD
jgi:hypothetical protein